MSDLDYIAKIPRPEPFYGPEDHDGISDPRDIEEDLRQRIAYWDERWRRLPWWQKLWAAVRYGR